MATHPKTTASETAPRTGQPGWSSFSGRVLDGGFELQEMLEADDVRARFKVRVLGDRDLDCVALFFRVDDADSERQVAIWTITRQLRHPNLSAPLGAGRLAVDGSWAIYCVVRRADESLDAVLQERALTADEAGEVLESVARALEVLQLNGMVFGCLSPARVLAVGETIQLPAECVRETGLMPAIEVFTPAYLAPEHETSEQFASGRQNTTAASDIWCLGATIFEALARKPWSESLRQETGELPEPFASIALRCLHADPEGRANLGEVMALYRGEIKPLARVRAAAAGASGGSLLAATAIAQSSYSSFPEAAAFAAEQSTAPRTDSAVDRLGEADPAVAPSSDFEDQSAEPEAAAPWYPPSAASLNVADAGPDNSPLASRLPHLVRGEPDKGTGREAAGAGSAAQSVRPGSRLRSGLDDAMEKRMSRRRGPSDLEEEPAASLWAWAAVLLLVVCGLIWVLRPKTVSVTPTPAAAAKSNPGGQTAALPAPATGKVTGANAWQTQTLQPDGSVVKPATPAAGSQAGASGSAGAAVWRVVAFTYLHHDDAVKKAHSVNARDGGLHASVFSPSGSSPYLVVLGGRMTREDAAQLRRKALVDGLPRDSYIQNYSR